MFYLDNQSEKMNNWHILLLFRQIKIINTKARTLFSYTRKIPVPENRGIKEAVNTYIVLSAVDVIIISSPYPWQELTQKALTMAVKTVIAKLIIFFKLIRIIFY